MRLPLHRIETIRTQIWGYLALTALRSPSAPLFVENQAKPSTQTITGPPTPTGILVGVEPIECPLSPDGSLSLTTLRAALPGAQGLCYVQNGVKRICRLDGTMAPKIMPPQGGWDDNTTYLVSSMQPATVPSGHATPQCCQPGHHHSCCQSQEDLQRYENATEKFQQSVASVQKILEMLEGDGHDSPEESQKVQEQLMQMAERLNEPNVEEMMRLKKENEKLRNRVAKQDILLREWQEKVDALELDNITKDMELDKLRSGEKLIVQREEPIVESEVVQQQYHAQVEATPPPQQQQQPKSILKTSRQKKKKSKHFHSSMAESDSIASMAEELRSVSEQKDSLERELMGLKAEYDQTQNQNHELSAQIASLESELRNIMVASEDRIERKQLRSDESAPPPLPVSPVDQRSCPKCDVKDQRIKKLESDCERLAKSYEEFKNVMIESYTVKDAQGQDWELSMEYDTIENCVGLSSALNGDMNTDRETTRRVWFELDQDYLPDGKYVYLLGSFVDWQCGMLCTLHGHGRYGVWIDLPPGKYEFRFMVDGKWFTSKHYGRCWNEFGTENNWVQVD